MKVSNVSSVSAYGTNFNKSNHKEYINNIQINPMRTATNPLIDKNYGVLQTKTSNVSFKGGLPVPVNNLGNKVNNLFTVIRSNDLIVTAPNYKVAIDSLKENVDKIKTVIKRVFIIEENGLDRTIGFKKNLENKETINLSESILPIKDSKGETGFLKKGETGYLLEGDTVNPGLHEIVINEQKQVKLPVKDYFNFFIEFDKEVDPKIQEINEKSLSKIGISEKKEVKEHKITFSDVGGMDSTIKELKKNILFPIKHPEIKNGKNMRKSVLLYGPPGTGKSFMAEACANEAGAWFKKVNASELDSKWVGESEANWRELFGEAKKNQPSIIFIDEIDAIAKKRGGNDTYGDKTLNTILALMSDSEKKGDQIYMLAATNKKSLLDDAVTRSGRFGLAIEVKNPDLKGTGEILDKYIANEPVAKDFKRDEIVKKLHEEQATGADIAAFAEDARNAALEREKIYEKMDDGTYTPKDMENLRIKNEDFEAAIDILKNNKKDAKPERRPIGFTSGLYQ